MNPGGLATRAAYRRCHKPLGFVRCVLGHLGIYFFFSSLNCWTLVAVSDGYSFFPPLCCWLNVAAPETQTVERALEQSAPEQTWLFCRCILWVPSHFCSSCLPFIPLWCFGDDLCRWLRCPRSAKDLGGSVWDANRNCPLTLVSQFSHLFVLTERNLQATATVTATMQEE